MHRARWAALALMISPAYAEVADWALPDAEASLVMRNANHLPDLLRRLDARFGQTRAFKGVAKRLQAFEFEGFRPLAGDWGPGFDPGAGLALFAAGSPPRVRFVVGSKDEAATKAALSTLAGLLSLKLEVTPEGLRFQEEVGRTTPPGLPDAPDAPPDAAPPVAHQLKCAQHDGFLVCDTEEVPTTAPGRPAELSADARLELLMREGPMTQGAGDSPVNQVHVVWSDTPTGGHVEMRGRLRPEAALSLAKWAPGDTPVAGSDCIDARSGGVARLSVDGPRFIQAARSLNAGPPPEALPVLAALEKAWSGEVVLSFAGSLLHPVLAFGLQPGADGRALIKALVAPLATEEVPINVTATAIDLELPSVDADAPQDRTVVHVQYGTTAESLILALAPRDVERCTGGTQQRMVLPPQLAAKGRSGLVLQGPLGSADSLADLITSTGRWQAFSDAVTVVRLAFTLVDQLGASVDLSGMNPGLDLWWEVL